MFKTAHAGEAYKAFFKIPFVVEKVEEYEEVASDGVLFMRGQSYRKQFHGDNENEDRFAVRLKNYFWRKYEGMTSLEADEILATIDACTFRPRLRIISGTQTEDVTTFYDLKQWEMTSFRDRASCLVAADLEGTTGSCDIHYSRVLKLVQFELGMDYSGRWSNWRKGYELVIMDWAVGMEVGLQDLVFKNCEAVSAFSGATVEDACVIQRLISVVDHVLPSFAPQAMENSSISIVRRGRKRCYFLDDCSRANSLLKDNATNVEGTNLMLQGIRRR